MLCPLAAARVAVAEYGALEVEAPPSDQANGFGPSPVGWQGGRRRYRLGIFVPTLAGAARRLWRLAGAAERRVPDRGAPSRRAPLHSYGKIGRRWQQHVVNGKVHDVSAEQVLNHLLP